MLWDGSCGGEDVISKLDANQMQCMLKKFFSRLRNKFSNNKIIHKNGYWCGEEIVEKHCYDESLAQALVTFFKNEKIVSIVDFGCGLADYVKLFRIHQFECDGFDGNPATPILSQGVASIKDLSQKFKLNKSYDWVLSLEVGEHLPQKFQNNFIQNLHCHNKQGMIISWAVKGQGGFGHFNEQDNTCIKKIITEYGYINDLEVEELLRSQATLHWFKNTIMVFRKLNNIK